MSYVRASLGPLVFASHTLQTQEKEVLVNVYMSCCSELHSVACAAVTFSVLLVVMSVNLCQACGVGASVNRTGIHYVARIFQP